MMKRLLVLVLLSLISTVKLKAQCTPDTSIHTAGVYPDSATGFGAFCETEKTLALVSDNPVVELT